MSTHANGTGAIERLVVTTYFRTPRFFEIEQHIAVADERGTLVALFGPQGDENHARSMADARRFAASAGLLESAKRMLAMMEHDHAEEIANDHGGDDSCSYCDWMNEARALIAQVDCEVSA